MQRLGKVGESMGAMVVNAFSWKIVKNHQSASVSLKPSEDKIPPFLDLGRR
jgi:hypothetical protein